MAKLEMTLKGVVEVPDEDIEAVKKQSQELQINRLCTQGIGLKVTIKPVKE